MSDEPTTDEIERALKQADCSVYYDRTIGSPEVHIEAELDTPGDVLRQAYRAMRDLYLERQTTLADAEVGDVVELTGWDVRMTVNGWTSDGWARMDTGDQFPPDTPCTIVERAADKVTFGDLEIRDRFKKGRYALVLKKCGPRHACCERRGDVEIFSVDPDTEVEPVEGQ